jgi:hypothetical protein
VDLRRVCLVSLLAGFAALAQRPSPVVSPEVLPDHRVTFRIKAPKASDVTLTGDWLGTAQPPKLTKDDTPDNQGVWSVTLGPFEPSIYIYSFTVDGIAMADPINPRIKLRASTSASLLEVKSDPAAFWEARDVPHGAVEINWEKSKAINGETRAIWIIRRPDMRRAPLATPCFICSTGPTTRRLAGPWQAAPISSSTTFWPTRRRYP